MNKYYEQLKNISHYQNYECMIPYVGDHYDSNSHKRLLIIAESHYLPEGSTIQLDAKTWYEGKQSALNNQEISWIHTSDVVKYSGNHIFKVIKSALAEAGLYNDDSLEHIAFMNYFLRPAITKDSIKDIATEEDHNKAYENIKSVIDVLKPEIIIFVSKYALLSAEDRVLWEYTEPRNCQYTYTAHPMCSWWNRVTKDKIFEGRTSREHFIHFLKKQNFIGK